MPTALLIGDNDQYRKTDLSKRLSFFHPGWLSLSLNARRKAFDYGWLSSRGLLRPFSM